MRDSARVAEEYRRVYAQVIAQISHSSLNADTLTRKRSSVRRCSWSATRIGHGFVHETLRGEARDGRRRGPACAR